jgi:Flp pilus assembly protein TadB
MTDEARTLSSRKSLFRLISDLPKLVGDLVRGEIELVKAELIAKAKEIGIGVGLVAGAALFLLWFVSMLFVAAAFALSAVMPGWLAALLIAVVLLIIAVVLGLLGYNRIKKGMPPFPAETIGSVKRDVNAIKGTGGPRP